MSATSPQQSIFTAELVAVLTRRGHTVDGLRRVPFSFGTRTVDRLEESQRSLTHLPGLSHGDLMTIVLLLRLSEEERLRLYAALIALGAQRLLLDYISPQRAWEIACEVRDAALVWLRTHGSEDDLLRRRSQRGITASESLETSDGALLLQAALEAYDEGVRAQALGMFLGETSDGRHSLERAVFYLERAEGLLQRLPSTGHANGESDYWLGEVRRVLDEVRAEMQ
jgi:hypothetical protein